MEGGRAVPIDNVLGLPTTRNKRTQRCLVTIARGLEPSGQRPLQPLHLRRTGRPHLGESGSGGAPLHDGAFGQGDSIERVRVRSCVLDVLMIAQPSLAEAECTTRDAVKLAECSLPSHVQLRRYEQATVLSHSHVGCDGTHFLTHCRDDCLSELLSAGII